MVMLSCNSVFAVRTLRIAPLFIAVVYLIFLSSPSSLPSSDSRQAVEQNWKTWKSSPTCAAKISDADFTPTAIRCRIQSALAKTGFGRKAQSSSPEEAVVEYQRRYNRTTPKGFKDWVQFALDHGSKLIDDFDQIDLYLEPYRTAEARRVAQLIDHEGPDYPFTTRIIIQNGNMSTSAGYMYEDGLRRLIEPFVHALPDSKFYLSTIDEARILASSGPPPPSVEFKERPAKSIEDLILDSCAQIPRRLTDDQGQDKDVCQLAHPADVHAFVASPSTFSYTHSLVPMLSFGRMSAFRDILIPCPCYTGHPLVVNDTMAFLDKKPAIYWRGQTTGGHATRFKWKSGHRQRLVAFVQSLQNAASVLDNARFFGLNLNHFAKGQFSLFKNVFDIQVGGYVQCEEDTCKDMERVLGSADREPEDTSSEYRYLFDLDGNSMSTRFYRLLSRQSVVLKQTLFQEWHDDRLVPWAHYIPVTMGMEELPTLVNFLVNDPAGEELSAEIAQSGSSWARETLREIDMSIYMYRLLLEMSALYSQNDTEGAASN